MTEERIKELISYCAWNYKDMETLGDYIKFTLRSVGLKVDKEGLTFLKKACEEMIEDLAARE